MKPLQSPKIVVWMGVQSGGLIGAIVFAGMVAWMLPQLLQFTSFSNHTLIFQTDDAPPHWYRAVRDWLDTNFPNLWIEREGPISWLVRSPDLTPLDFWLWDDLKKHCKTPHTMSYINKFPRKLDRLTQTRKRHWISHSDFASVWRMTVDTSNDNRTLIIVFTFKIHCLFKWGYTCCVCRNRTCLKS